MADPVDWVLAERVATRLAGGDPFSRSYHYASLQPDFDELTSLAETLVTAETGLVPLAGPARARVASRQDWVRANIAAFRRLLRPITERLAERLSGPIAPVGRKFAGAEVGTLLGWMAGRVLGQYDLLVVEDENPDQQDIVYYVGTNVLAMEKRYAFPPREFRLWLALHEVTHRAQFTGVPWMREHFLGLVQSTLAAADPDPKRFLDAIGRAAEEVRLGRNPLDQGGLVALLASPEQRAAIEAIGGLMSLLEGHGDVTMDRAGKRHLPEAERFSRILRQRRQTTGIARLLRQLVGIEAKLQQYAMGERFIEHVERERDPEFLIRVWRSPELLPTMAEIRDPGSWVARLDASAASPTAVAPPHAP